MKRKRYTPEQILKLLDQIQIKASNGHTLQEACRELGVKEMTFYRWKKKYGGMESEEVRRLKKLERQNNQLKEIVADLTLDNKALKFLAEGNF